MTVNPIAEPHLSVELALIHPSQRPLSRASRYLYDHFSEELQRCKEEWQRATS